ncbi:MAG TPA: carboxypeptidase regulatory-like domain-containing protein, partial [Bryobacteraceae bacterium]|nr:carboxypeptidase regulatory-like domain-containing protein [Bryobacteraceae bacterium]
MSTSVRNATFLSLALTMWVFAQNASLQGILTDSSGAIVQQVEVVLTKVETGTTATTKTNDVGLYSFPSLSTGTYVLTASKAGFQQATSQQIPIAVGQAARVDMSLQPGNVGEKVTVTANAAALETESTQVGQVINNRTIVNLPLNGRNYLELAKLTSGTGPAVGSRTANAGAFSAGGQHGWQTNVQLDGVDNNSRESGGQLGYEAQSVTPSVDAVEEFRVVTNNLSAEYGGRMGGTVIVNLRSGTNSFHGSAFEFLRNSTLDGTNFFANLNGAGKPPFKRNQFGGTAGGRIIRDKLFYFGSFEGTRTRNGQSFTSTVPTALERQGNFSQQLPIFDPATTQGSGGSMTRQPF